MSGVGMNKDLLCTWLELAKADWPPDAWALLGLPKGEHDLPAIGSQQVQARMAKRCYQISFPEEATEGMNRLAEAFVTLTDACACAKATPPKPPAAETKLDRSKDDTSIGEKTSQDQRTAPPPVGNGVATATKPEILVEDSTIGEVLTAKPFVAPARPP